ncbi:unnamed protein product [Adineta ricciae]|uniref:Uncharacterized protein n=1 Tax=Adineta ricciae TaxID=249248 RepID=A0A814MN46_ADIRI|nr:unnamed protein product [Adineta ricciae]CAF1623613.1 unnamed protein product [Adineta ricciae]
MFETKYILFWLIISAFFGGIAILLGISNDGLRPKSTSVVCASQGKEFFPKNSRFLVTKRSGAYDYNLQPSCWLPDCKKINNHLAFRQCSNSFANDWNVLGVNSMERYLDGQWNTLPGYNIKSLEDAIWYFTNATTVEPSCAQAWMNLAIASMESLFYSSSLTAFSKAFELFEEKSDLATVQLFWGLTEESQGNKESGFSRYDESRTLDVEVERRYWGIAMVSTYRQELNNYGSKEPLDALRSFGTFAYFSPTSIGEWALLMPGTQDWFLENRYIILRKILPPFILNAVSKYYRELIDHNVLELGDVQSKRYVAYNDRVGRFLQNQLTQLVRSIIAHNAKPSCTYFGGYVSGATLEAHTDRAQCEFTISMNVEHYPHNRTWLLSLDKDPLFDKDPLLDKTMNTERHANVKTTDESKIVHADLYAGDGFLFMGRHLIHFRTGALPEGEWTNQLFMHFVQEGYDGDLN